MIQADGETHENRTLNMGINYLDLDRIDEILSAAHIQSCVSRFSQFHDF